ncbi:hypothetical protein CEUSTIGMA_g13829.t1, partial [Chlamydomonas eustigma]
FAHRVLSVADDNDEISSVAEEEELFFEEDAPNLPLPVIAKTLTSVTQDKTMLMALFNSDISTPRNKAQSLQAISKAIVKAVSEAMSKSARRGDLVEKESSRLVTGPDAEGEVWASMLFLSHVFEEQREETFWIEEFRRLANVAQKLFASRFSQSYVEDLMRKAGTSDDMKCLANYVRSQCRLLNHHS